jgi:peptidoglycan/xylan/chitin deacetylase (PgdA/CDA1 family)
MKLAYLTIDDGPVAGFIPKIDFLESKGIKAIWTCQGNHLQKYELGALYAISKGHIIGNHSYDHPYFSKISLEEAKRQILETDQIIDNIYKKAKAKRPMKVFRFPFLDNGAGNDYDNLHWEDSHVQALQSYLSKAGYKQPAFDNLNYEWYRKAGLNKCANIDCTYDTFDWVLTESEPTHGYHDLPSLLARIDEDVPEGCRGINNPNSNEIIMMHAWIPMEAFQQLIEKLLRKGLIFKLPACSNN